MTLPSVQILTQSDLPLMTEVPEDLLLEFGSTPDIPSSLTAEIMKMLRVRVGLTENDSSKDVLIINGWVMAVKWAEKHLDRYLVDGAYTEVFTHIQGMTLRLKAFPVTEILSFGVAQGSTTPTYHVDSNSGVVHFDSRMVSHQIEVSYTANPQSDTMISMALLLLFDSVWLALSGSAAADQTGGIKSISTPDVGSITYFDKGTAAGFAAGEMPPAVAAIFGLIRRLDA